MSLMATPGAMEVAVELNSLSKSHNMAGWRVGMLVGSKDRISEVLKFKSNMDSGMFLPLQMAAAAALQLDGEWYKSVNEVYKKRQAGVFKLLNLLDCRFNNDQAGMFVWASIPGSYKDGYALSDKVLQEANVFITPGGIFGSNGLGYVRVSLCATEEKIKEALQRIKSISK
jgi:aspartate/methionine/tyrosine aminotransferase